MSIDCPSFALSEEHEALRAAVRELAEDKIAPRAAEVDRTSELPQDVYEALVKAALHAVHIPVEYGGGGGGARARPRGVGAVGGGRGGGGGGGVFARGLGGGRGGSRSGCPGGRPGRMLRR